MRIRLEFRPRDFWVGASWRITEGERLNPGEERPFFARNLHIWLGLIPCLQLHVIVLRKRYRDEW